MSDPTTREERAANLFDLRRIIGGVFLAWGILLIILGLTGSETENNKAAGININLYAGIGMLIVAIVFLVWAFTRPLGQEISESEQASRSTGSDGEGTRRPGNTGRE
jgi:uncharacterized oligopeptide transporter (OPT) family protein